MPTDRKWFSFASRYGQMEYRDPHRTKDKNGAPVLCFQCGTSALPRPMSQDTVTSEKRSLRQSTHDTESELWRSIVSCDFCPLHWHLDCLNPPLLVMPPLDKKWMCPNHVDHTLVSTFRLISDHPCSEDRDAAYQESSPKAESYSDRRRPTWAGQ